MQWAIGKSAIGDRNLPLVKIDIGAVVIDQNVKDGSTDGNDGCRGVDTVWIGPPAEFFDLNSRLALDDIDQVAGSIGQIFNLDRTFGSNDDLGTVSKGKNHSSISSGNDYVLRKKKVLWFDDDGDRERRREGRRLSIKASSDIDLSLDDQNSGGVEFLAICTDRKNQQADQLKKNGGC